MLTEVEATIVELVSRVGPARYSTRVSSCIKRLRYRSARQCRVWPAPSEFDARDTRRIPSRKVEVNYQRWAAYGIATRGIKQNRLPYAQGGGLHQHVGSSGIEACVLASRRQDWLHLREAHWSSRGRVRTREISARLRRHQPGPHGTRQDDRGPGVLLTPACDPIKVSAPGVAILRVSPGTDDLNQRAPGRLEFHQQGEPSPARIQQAASSDSQPRAHQHRQEAFRAVPLRHDLDPPVGSQLGRQLVSLSSGGQ